MVLCQYQMSTTTSNKQNLNFQQLYFIQSELYAKSQAPIIRMMQTLDEPFERKSLRKRKSELRLYSMTSFSLDA